MRLSRWRCPVLLGLLCALAGTAEAEAKPHPLLKGFERSGQYILQVDGKHYKEARLYHSRLAAAFLIMNGPYEAPLLISPRTRVVQKVAIDKVFERDDGLIYLLDDVKLTDMGTFSFTGGQVVFTVDDISSRLSPTPPLLGRRSYEDVVNHTPEFVRAGKLHPPNKIAMDNLKKHGGKAKVLVVFGSWCPACKRHMPMILRVNRELSETGMTWEYHALPKPPAAWRDSAWLGTGAKKLPAIVVSSPEGRRLGLISGAETGQTAEWVWSMVK